jgi:3-hydroxyacyl-CoA dehydrogenase
MSVNRIGVIGAGTIAATENLELKLRILKQLDEGLPAGALLATNTSSISMLPPPGDLP